MFPNVPIDVLVKEVGKYGGKPGVYLVMVQIAKNAKGYYHEAFHVVFHMFPYSI